MRSPRLIKVKIYNVNQTYFNERKNYKVIQKLLTIFIFPLLLASTQLKLTEEDIKNNRDYYEVIQATTGKKETSQLYAETAVIETHITAVSAIKKALANEGIDPSKIRVLLYYDGLTIRDDSPPRKWQAKPYPDTITSPWLDITKTVTTSGETRITIRIDATAARLLSDLFAKPEDKYSVSDFLEIPSIKESCFNKIFSKYEIAASRIFNTPGILRSRDTTSVVSEVRKNYGCVPEDLREPLLSILESSDHSGMGMVLSPFYFNVFDQLNRYCQDVAKEYYNELYPNLAVKGLQILESESNSEPKWWTEIIDQIKPIQEC